MALDPTRAQLVMQEYRYSIVEDATIRALHPNATEIIMETNLDATGGTALATSLFDATSALTRVFTVKVEGVLFPDDFLEAPNRYVVNFPKHPAAGTSSTYTVIRAEIDYFNSLTTLTVRG